MIKRILLAGTLGGITLICWTFVINAFFGFTSRIAMKPIPHESRVYQTLKENILAPGGYMCNPALTPSGVFPLHEPLIEAMKQDTNHETH